MSAECRSRIIVGTDHRFSRHRLLAERRTARSAEASGQVDKILKKDLLELIGTWTMPLPAPLRQISIVDRRER